MARLMNDVDSQTLFREGRHPLRPLLWIAMAAALSWFTVHFLQPKGLGDKQTFGLICLALAAVGAGWFFVRVPLLAPRRSVESAAATVGLFICGSLPLWNRAYVWFVDHLNEKGLPRSEVFRKALKRDWTPVYGAPEQDIASHLPWIIAAVAALMLIAFLWIIRGGRAWMLATLACSGLTMFTVFFCETNKIIPDLRYSAYRTFAMDYLYFRGNDLHATRDWVANMPRLGWMASHYPPGIILLCSIDTRFGAVDDEQAGAIAAMVGPREDDREQQRPGTRFAAVTLVAALVLTSLWPAHQLGLLCGLSALSARAGAALLALTSGFITYATQNPGALSLPAGAWLVYFWIASIGPREQPLARSLKFASLLGATMLLWTFMSFGATIAGLLLAVFTVVGCATKQIDFKRAILAGVWSVGVFCLVGVLLWVVTGYSTYAGLIAGIFQHDSQQGDPFSPRDKWFFRSTGNFLAYCYAVLPLLGASLWATVARGKFDLLSVLGWSMGLTLAIISCSGLFWLETERIWTCFTPIYAVLAAGVIDAHVGRQRIIVAAGLLIVAATHLATYEAVFQPYR
jgi:hypothetical protein